MPNLYIFENLQLMILCIFVRFQFDIIFSQIEILKVLISNHFMINNLVSYFDFY